MSDQDRKRRRSRVPDGPLERLGRIGWMAGELAIGGLSEQVRSRWRGEAVRFDRSLLAGANPERIAARLATMRGAAMKLGQLVSMEGDDLLPPELSDALARLRADGDAMPDAQLERVLVEEWSPRWRERVADFDPEPIAAASIGQVHRATAHDGRTLALKIQFPGVARSIDADVDNLVRLARWSRLLPDDLDLAALGEEARRQLRQEADYRLEGRHLALYGALLGDEPGVAIPRVHEPLTTRRILAMDHLEGPPLEELCGPDTQQSQRDRVGALLYRLLLRELFELRFLQSDPNLGNFLWMPASERVGLIDLGGAHHVPRELSERMRTMLEAVLMGDRDRLARVVLDLGYVTEAEPRRVRDAVVRLIELGWEPFRHDGPYDFAGSTLPDRLREAGLALAFEMGFRRPPPVETLFVHRKLAGTFLLCARLRARVDLRRIASPFLANAAA